MSKSTQVVDGEASESDSEIEIGKTPDTTLAANSEVFVISGEAPESDDDSKISSPQCPTDLDLPLHSVLLPPTRSTPTTPNKLIYTSLLHQKLWECNVSLRATVEGLARHTTDITVEKLSRADKTLLNVQESMRATNANLTLAKARLKQVHAALEKANCGAAFPTVKIKL